VDAAQLRCFLAVAEELHFGRAARRLHIAQPPLSRTIKQLERELDTALFERTTRSVRPTVAGEALVGPAREVLDALRRAEAAARAADEGGMGVVRVAFAGVSTHRLVARLARAVRSRHPGIQLELSSQQYAEPAMKRLQQGDTDIALGRWDVIPPEIEVHVAMRDSLVVALPDSHPLAGAGELSIAHLADASWVSLPEQEGAVLPDRLSRLARDHGFAADVVQIAPDSLTALALVSAEVGCHLTLASVARHAADPQVAFVPLQEVTPDVDLRVVWRHGDTTPAVSAVLGELLTFDGAPEPFGNRGRERVATGRPS
jgi:DNA-binding transcriptional LysR family regulator